MTLDLRSLGPMHISANQNYEPQRTNNFQLEIYGLEGASTEEIMLAVSDFSLPTISNSPVEIGRGNSKVKFAGQTEFSGMDSLQVIDYIPVDIEKIIRDWHIQVYNPETDQIGWAYIYKKDGLLIEFAPDGTQLRGWEIKGLWPSSVNYGGSLSMDGAEVKKIEITMAYDKAWRLA